MSEARKILLKYIPDQSVDQVLHLINSHKELSLKITRSRTTKLGDYRKINNFQHRITVNNNLNNYQFLLTLLHEIAHFLTYKEYGRRVKPHGKEWKYVFSKLLLAYIKPEIFPKELIPLLLNYAKNPKASTAGDGDLYVKLSKYDKNRNPQLKYVFELEKGTVFALNNGQQFQLQEKRRTRYKCVNIQNKKSYLIHKNAEVTIVNKPNN